MSVLTQDDEGDLPAWSRYASCRKWQAAMDRLRDAGLRLDYHANAFLPVPHPKRTRLNEDEAAVSTTG
jgi:hypothetical protein